MLAKFILSLALLNSEGHLEIVSFGVGQCPSPAEFTDFMNKQSEVKKLLDWSYTCIPAKTEDVTYEEGN